MNPFKKLAGQTAIYGLPSIIGRILNYLLVPLHTVLFSQSEYGIQNYFYAIAAFMAVALTYGMETAFFRYFSKEKDNSKVYSTAQISLLISTVVFMIVSLIYAGSIASFLGYTNKSIYVKWFVLILGFDALSAIPFALLRMQNKAFNFASVKLVNILTNIFFNLFFLVIMPYLNVHYSNPEWLSWMTVSGWTVEYVFIANLIASIVTLILLSPIAFKISHGFDLLLWKQMFLYALPLLFFGMAGIINETFDRVLLKYLLPENIAEAQIGIYGACYKIAILMAIFIQAYKYAAEPFFFSYYKEKNSGKTFADLMNYFIIIVSMLFLFTVMNLDIIIHFIGKDFREGRNIIPILLLSHLFLGVFYNLSIWYKLSDRTIWGAIISILGAIITLTLNFIWIPKYGFTGSAWANFVCYLTMMLISYLLGKKYYPIPYNVKKFLFYMVVSVSLYFISELIPINNTTLKLLFNNSLLLVFILITIKTERITLSKLKRFFIRK